MWPNDLTRELERRWQQEGLSIAEFSGQATGVLAGMPAVESNDRWSRRYEGGGYRLGRLSPDGRKIVAYNEGERISGLHEIRVLDLDGRVEARFSDYEFTNVYTLALSPDGKRVAFEGEYRQRKPRAGNYHQGDWQRVLGIVALGQKVITVASGTNVQGAHPSRASASDDMGWGPDSNELVYEKDGRIIIYSVKSGTKTEIALGNNPTWSPDGTWIAFVDPDRRATLIRPNGSGKHRLAIEKPVYPGLHWSPDSRYLLYSVKELHFLIFYISSTALRVYRITDGATSLVGPTILVSTSRDWGWLFLPTSAPQP